MTVCVLAEVGRGGLALASMMMGSTTAMAEVSAGGRLAPPGPQIAEAKVFLASCGAPHEAILALFALPAAQKGRKILSMAGAEPDAAALVGQADMLIFKPTDFARFLDLDAEPQDQLGLDPIRRFLTRPNQAAVVAFAGRGAAAVWADRTLFVDEGSGEGDAADGWEDAICGVIAAAVDQGIGPERALALANAAAALAQRGPDGSLALPSRAAVEHRLDVTQGAPSTLASSR